MDWFVFYMYSALDYIDYMLNYDHTESYSECAIYDDVYILGFPYMWHAYLLIQNTTSTKITKYPSGRFMKACEIQEDG